MVHIKGGEAFMLSPLCHIPDSVRQTCILCKPAVLVMLSASVYLIDYILEFPQIVIEK